MADDGGDDVHVDKSPLAKKLGDLAIGVTRKPGTQKSTVTQSDYANIKTLQDALPNVVCSLCVYIQATLQQWWSRNQAHALLHSLWIP